MMARYMGSFLRQCVILVALVVMSALSFASRAADDPGAGDEPVVRQLLTALAENNYSGFVGNALPEFQAVTEQQFHAVAAQIGPRLRKGYQVDYFGTVRQLGLDISVWKISFNDSGDDHLATLNVQDGKVRGFFLR